MREEYLDELGEPWAGRAMVVKVRLSKRLPGLVELEVCQERGPGFVFRSYYDLGKALDRRELVRVVEAYTTR
mgnify:CR=1 FL=1